MSSKTSPAATMLVVTRADLRAELDSIVSELVYEPQRALLDRAGLATMLDVSLSTCDKIRREPGFPVLHVTESTERYERDAVLAWLRARPAPTGGR